MNFMITKNEKNMKWIVWPKNEKDVLQMKIEGVIGQTMNMFCKFFPFQWVNKLKSKLIAWFVVTFFIFFYHLIFFIQDNFLKIYRWSFLTLMCFLFEFLNFLKFFFDMTSSLFLLDFEMVRWYVLKGKIMNFHNRKTFFKFEEMNQQFVSKKYTFLWDQRTYHFCGWCHIKIFLKLHMDYFKKISQNLISFTFVRFVHENQLSLKQTQVFTHSKCLKTSSIDAIKSQWMKRDFRKKNSCYKIFVMI